MCIRSTTLVCASSKSYLIKVDPKCLDKIVEYIKEHGRITASFGPLIKAVYKDVPVTILKPDRIQVMLVYSDIEIDELVEDLKKAVESPSSTK
ncbi:MAG: hypothetical protein DRJ35_05610 [Thermoprotei archaeon]|nr:MAG: hypothetical protein DRJ35_05610 [Thermoprotei archaeon]